MILTIHDPILPQGKGINNIKNTMEEAFKVIENALPSEYKTKRK
jgi:1-acyl-sn-glycerol-3-phosphate acyltransferase